MGYTRHHAIIVTSWDIDLLFKAYKRAVDVFPRVSGIVSSLKNRYKSFFIAPDGSKEGWLDSIYYDGLRAGYISYLRTLVNEDGSSSINWAEVQYGDDEDDNKVLHCSSRNVDENYESEKEAQEKAR